MYNNESYEQYIRSILGYQNYDYNYYENSYDANMLNSEKNMELEACYPEIYKIVYPMVCKACDTNTKPITSELINDLTNEIYSSIEIDNEINVNINLKNDVRSMENRDISHNMISKKSTESRGEERQFRNKGLQDLIQILLIRELLARQRRFPENKPMFSPNRPPIRPPFPVGQNIFR